MKREHWRQHLEAQERSGLGMTEYCKEHGLALSSFRYHRDRKEARFVRVGGKEEHCELSLGDGTVLRFPRSKISAVVTAIISAIK